ncbi:hypothetical protein BdWA1_000486 [Babesia duncani]|uniref:Uncharacterized protein n=1 Tax=Babesia duncani TaxID=323732 RepID=A0AAD9PH68_9APIC|nr:hypothetical protein BdWA1_003742 [Babesia duncani]KAK2197486.1 hypothetical protein BdWA1_000486 [Babesia duncani]
MKTTTLIHSESPTANYCPVHSQLDDLNNSDLTEHSGDNESVITVAEDEKVESRVSSLHATLNVDNGAPSKWSTTLDSVNNGFFLFRMTLVRSSGILAILLWIMAVFYGGLGMGTEEWRYHVVRYKGEGFAGYSATFIGLCGISRYDALRLSDGTEASVTRPEIDYTKLKEHCLDKKEKRTRVSMQPPDPSCAMDDEGIHRVGYFRTISAVGNLNENGRAHFDTLHGGALYDLHCSQVGPFGEGGTVMFGCGIASLILFTIFGFMILDRVGLYSKGPFRCSLSVRILLRNTANVIWILSFICSIAGFVAWAVMTGASACIDHKGLPSPCPLSASSYFYMVYIVSSAACGLFYNCV